MFKPMGMKMPHVAGYVKWLPNQDVSCLADKRKDKLPPRFSDTTVERMTVVGGELRQGG
ncbi:MAG: hypothetical protein AB7L09_23120 [Nitrospira sp.]